MLRNKEPRDKRIITGHDFITEEKEEVTGWRLVFGYFGIFLCVIGVLILMPLIMLIFYPEESSNFVAFLLPGLISFISGLLLSLFIFRKKQGRLTTIEDLILLIGVWILAILLSSIPYYFYGYNFHQAMFESTSGYTSAGLTIMDWGKEIKDLGNGTSDVYSHMLFFHRALTELVGGIGLVLVVSSAISERSGLNIYLLEGHNDKLLPNLAKSARLIFSIYLGYIIFGTILYCCVGVKPFDALTHAMTAVATGGFSTKANNVNTLVMEVSRNGEWRGVFVEIVSEFLMLAGGTNFVIHYSLFRGKFKVLRHFEFWAFVGVMILVWPFMVAGMTKYYNGNIAAGFRYGTFEMISGLSTCGFQAIDSYQAHAIGGSGIYGFSQISSTITPAEAATGYANGSLIQFPTYLLFLLGLVMIIGMQNGSTSGAVKMNRVSLCFMDIWWRIKKTIGIPEQKEVHMIYRYGHKTKVEKNEVTEAWTYLGIYVATLLIGATLMSAIIYGCNITKNDGLQTPYTWLDCFFEFSSCIGTVGLGCGITNVNTLPLLLWIEMIGMLLGRLEIFVYFTLVGKMIRRARNHKFLYRKA